MAPEQVRGEAADRRTDIWALGVLLYEMASGVKPFDAPAMPELFSAILKDSPRPLVSSAPTALKVVIERCLEKDPARRYQQATDVGAALQNIIRGAAPWIAWRYHLGRHPVVASATAALAIAAMVLGLDVGGIRTRLRETGERPIKLAVLPFENLTGDPAQEYFSDGLTDEMIGQLSRLQPLRLGIIARTSSMRYKNRDVPIDQIGRELGVEYVLEGSARREGSRVRINVTLVQARDQVQRWSDSFERELAGILVLQSDIARGVAQSLALSLLPEEQARLATARTVDPEAFEAYLKGASHAAKLNRADLDRAMEYFDTVVKKDPNYALAHVGIGRVWSARQQIGITPPAEAAPRMKEALTRAAALDDELPEVHLGLANAYTWSDWNWAAGEAEFKKTLALRPGYGEARAFYAHYLFIMRRPDEAIVELHRALELDPLSDLVLGLCGQGFLMARRFDDALRTFRMALDTAPRSMVGLSGYARALYHAGRYDEAIKFEKEVWNVRNDREVVEALDRGYATGDYHAPYRAAADTLAARWNAGQKTVNPNAIVALYLRGHQPDRVFEWIDIAIATRDPNVPYIGAGPNWDSLRTDPRLQAVQKQLKLPR